MRKTVMAAVFGTLLVLGASVCPASAQRVDQDDYPDIRLFFQAGVQGGNQAENALRQLSGQWRVGYTGII